MAGVTNPTVCVRTGPSLGTNSLYACAWNCVTDSANNGCVTPEAPLNGFVTSWYFVPNKSNPLMYASSHSFLESLSFLYSWISSIAMSLRVLSSMLFARFALKSSCGLSSTASSSSTITFGSDSG